MRDNQTKNLIHVVDRLEVGGLENGVVNICNLLDRDMFNPMICCLNEAGPMVERLDSHVQVYNLRLPVKKSLSNIKKISSLFKEQRCDIVHTHAWGAGSLEGIVAGKIARVPAIINGEHGSFFERRYQVIIQRILFKACKANLAVSKSLREQLVKKYKLPRDGIKVIENGVDLEKFSGRYSKKKIIAKLNNEGHDIQYHAHKIISVGSLKPEKNQKLLLIALDHLPVAIAGKPVQLLLAGDGPDRKVLESIVEISVLNGRVFFLGNRNDIEELLAVADILVSTSISRHEGMSNVMLEAFASSVPVMATRSVGASEVVTDGYNGFLVDAEDSRQLADRIKLLFEQPDYLLQLGNHARITAEQTYSLEKMVQKYQEFYLQFASV